MPFRSVFNEVFALHLVIAGTVFVLVTGILLVAIVRNRATRRKELPFAAAKRTPVELGYAVVLGGIAAFLFYVSFQSNAELAGGEGLTAAEIGPNAVQIDVTAFRWCWEFAYREAPVTVTGDCTPDDFPVVVVPAGQPVEFSLTSDDVVHALWIPEWAAKRDAFPDHVNDLRMVFPEEGQWRGRCSEFCGTHHVTMDFYIRAVSPAEYEQFLAAGDATA